MKLRLIMTHQLGSFVWNRVSSSEYVKVFRLIYTSSFTASPMQLFLAVLAGDRRVREQCCVCLTNSRYLRFETAKAVNNHSKSKEGWFSFFFYSFCFFNVFKLSLVSCCPSLLIPFFVSYSIPAQLNLFFSFSRLQLFFFVTGPHWTVSGLFAFFHHFFSSIPRLKHCPLPFILRLLTQSFLPKLFQLYYSSLTDISHRNFTKSYYK